MTMINRKLLLPIAMIVLFCFSTTSVAGGLHLGMIDVVDSRIDDLGRGVEDKPTTQIVGTTGVDGSTTMYDEIHGTNVTISIKDKATGEAVAGVEFEYTNTGRTIMYSVRNNPDYFPSFTIQPSQQSSASVGHRQTAVVGVITVITVAVTIALSAWGTYELIFNDPPYVETIHHDSGWVEKRLCGDVEDIIDFLGIISFVGFKGKWVKFAISAGKAISGKVARKGLGAIGIDPYKKYCYTLYESRDDSTSKAPFMSVVEYTNDPPNMPSDPSPAPGATDQLANVVLGWTGGDPDPGDEVTYDVYFEANDSSPDELVSSRQSRTRYNPEIFSYDDHYYWRIVATDNHGKSTYGPVWDFITTDIDNPPTVEITNPSYGAIVSGTVTVSVNASDDGGIDRVRFYIDGNLEKTDSYFPYSYGWDTTQYSVGSHAIKVRCYDTANQTASDTLSVWVDRKEPVSPPRAEITIRPRPAIDWGSVLRTILLLLYLYYGFTHS